MVSSYGFGANELVGGDGIDAEAELVVFAVWISGGGVAPVAILLLPHAETSLDGATLESKKRSQYCQE
jgi:hypothetical protein